MKFLKEIAGSFYSREGQKISEICFVFPGRRAALFFQKELSEVAERPLFSPAVLTINDLFTRLSGLRVADRLDVLFRLYKIFTELSDSKESFDEFIFWGEIVLGDFDDADKYLVNADKLFANVRDLKEIESDYSFLSERQLEAVRSFWSSFITGENSEKKQKFKALWEVLYPMYIRIKEELEAEGCGYEGMIYRKIADSLRSGDNSGLMEKLGGYREVVFVGFNALNECEKLFMTTLQKSGKADFYWDFCGDMVTDPNNKASLFIRENMLRFPSRMNLDFTVTEKPQIEIIGVPSATGQTKLAGEIISEQRGGINSAVILPDESLLTPMLRSADSIPEGINVTMGYPLREGSIVSLVENFIELQKGSLYFRRVLPILRHSYIKLITPQAAEMREREITENNLIYINPELFAGDELLEKIFRKVTSDSLTSVENINRLSDYLLEIMDLLVARIDVTQVEKEFIYYLYTTVTKLKSFSIPMSVATYLRLFRQLVNSTSIPFRGEPLAGLQIMGVLETRCLDFDNLVICSMNEGVFPSRSSSNSFIPNNLRRGFSLPDYEYRDGVTAYHFYRTLYRAKKVWLLYDTRTEGLVTGEMSRFILQLKYHYQLKMKEKIATYKIGKTVTEPVVIDKNDKVLKELDFYLNGTRPLSASSISAYISCPLRFYFQYVRGITEETSVSESVEANTFGNIFHKSMESIYSNYKGKTVTKETLASIIKNLDYVENVVSEQFKKEQKIDEIKGHNLLVDKLIVRYVLKTLEFDKTIAPFNYIESEMRIEKPFSFAEGKRVNIKAFIDRVDERNGMLRIVDYKTGRNPDPFRDFGDIFNSASEKKYDVILQMYLYAMLLAPDRESLLTPYILREIVHGGTLELASNPELTEQFKTHLREKLIEIFNPEVPFVQTSALKRCGYCPFNQICR